MTKAEKARLAELAKLAVLAIEVDSPVLRDRALRIADEYSATNRERFRELAEFVWWLAAIGADGDSIRISNALCEVNDEWYWMFQAMGSVFATRAFLLRRSGQIDRSEADAISAWEWLQREPNYKPMTMEEVGSGLERFRAWLARADAERSPLVACHVLAHALRVLVIYEELAISRTPCTVPMAVVDYSGLIEEALDKLRVRIEAWTNARQPEN